MNPEMKMDKTSVVEKYQKTMKLKLITETSFVNDLSALIWAMKGLRIDHWGLWWGGLAHTSSCKSMATRRKFGLNRKLLTEWEEEATHRERHSLR